MFARPCTCTHVHTYTHILIQVVYNDTLITWLTYNTAGCHAHSLYCISIYSLGGGLAILYIGAVMFSSPQLASIRMFKTVFSIILSTRLLNSGRLWGMK